MKTLWIKYKEVIMYLIFGVATTVVNWVAYSILMKGTGIPLAVSNAIAWLVSVIFAYVTNKLWVFESKSWKINEVWKEIGLSLRWWLFRDCITWG